jgi:protein-S-isoprenylcysteine O-methyltransferase Ste14
MMNPKFKSLVGAVCGAAVGAVLARHYLHRPEDVPTPAHLAAGLRDHWALALCVAGWMIFSLYWEAAAKNAAAAQRTETSASRRVHVLLTNAALLIELIPVARWPRFLPASPLVQAGGVAVVAAGVSLAIWSRRHLGRNWSGEIAIKVEHQLIRSGPYGRLRHPIYTGILTMYAGTAIAAGTWQALLGLAIAGFAYGRKIQLEEAVLDKAFGAEYESYRRATWALVPGLF